MGYFTNNSRSLAGHNTQGEHGARLLCTNVYLQWARTFFVIRNIPFNYSISNCISSLNASIVFKTQQPS